MLQLDNFKCSCGYEKGILETDDTDGVTVYYCPSCGFQKTTGDERWIIEGDKHSEDAQLMTDRECNGPKIPGL